MSAAVQMLVGGVGLTVIALSNGEVSGFVAADVSMKSILSLVYLITFGSLGFFAYIWLLKWSPPAKAATYAFVNPIIALFLGNLLAGEVLSSRTILLSVVILTAVIIIVTSKNISRETITHQSDEQNGIPLAVDAKCRS